jgi:hypothetical protein
MCCVEEREKSSLVRRQYTLLRDTVGQSKTKHEPCVRRCFLKLITSLLLGFFFFHFIYHIILSQILSIYLSNPSLQHSTLYKRSAAPLKHLQEFTARFFHLPKLLRTSCFNFSRPEKKNKKEKLSKFPPCGFPPYNCF